MTETQIIKIIETWNRKVDRFTTDELPILLGYPEGTTEISMNDWFKAQQIINAQHFYENASRMQKTMRAWGFDVKIDMQSNKLVYGNIR